MASTHRDVERVEALHVPSVLREASSHPSPFGLPHAASPPPIDPLVHLRWIVGKFQRIELVVRDRDEAIGNSTGTERPATHFYMPNTQILLVCNNCIEQLLCLGWSLHQRRTVIAEG